MSRDLPNNRHEPIAIVGIGCRFPEASDANAFWSLIDQGQVTFREIPKERWNHQTFYSANQRDIDKAWVASGSFIEEFRDFAALHYGIAPRRLEVMDPQQRLLIESTRWAIQDAGLEVQGFDRRRTGVFFGVSVSEFKNVAQSRVHAMQLAGGDFGAPAGSEALREAVLEMASRIAPMRAFHLSGSLTALAAAAVAQTFDLGGPAYIIDSACASATVAVNDAMLHLRAGSLDYAVAGGVYLNLTPDNLVAFTKIGAISPDGVCRPFDHRSNGFVQSDGVGVLVLRRLEDAIRDGDRIHAVLIGSGCNNDGRGEGPMTPRFEGQVEALRLAYEDAAVSPNSIAYFEAHGTATSIGDPVEVRALGDVLKREGRSDPAWIGSVKGNIGHAMSAAGIAGLIKAVKVLQHRVVPPQPGFEKVNPKLDMESYPLRVSSERKKLDPVEGYPLRVAVSSFGFGGTNSHLVLEEAPVDERPRKVTQALELSLKEDPTAAPVVAPEALLITAAALPLLAEYSAKLAMYLSEGEGRRASLADLAFTLNARRDRERYRAVIGARTPAELIRNLRSAASALNGVEDLPLHVSPHVSIYDAGAPDERSIPKLAFLFPGQGAQKTGLLSDIRERFEPYRAAFERFESNLEGVLDRKLSSYLYPDENTAKAQAELTRTEICQPAMTASALALAELLNSVGVRAHTSLGHSLGEFTALANAKAIDPEDAVRLVAERGAAMRDLHLPDPGTMAAVMTDAETTQSLIEDIEGVVVANINHPRQVSISGATHSVEDACKKIQAAGHEVRRLEVSHAFHSPFLEGIRPRMTEFLEKLTFKAPQHIVASCIAGEVHTGDAQRTRKVLEHHATAPVEFVRGLSQTTGAGATLYLQLGAGKTLLSFARATLGRDTQTLVLASAEDDGGYTFIRALCTLAALGLDIDFEALYKDEQRRVVTLPETPLERQSYWVVREQKQPIPELNHPLPEKDAPAVHITAPTSTPASVETTESNTELLALFAKQAEVLNQHAAIIAAQNQVLMNSPNADHGELIHPPVAPSLPEPRIPQPEPQPVMAPKPVPAIPPDRPVVDESAIRSQVFEIISKVSAFPRDSLRGDQRLVDELGFDSLMVADLGGAIESTFPSAGGLPPTLFGLQTTVGDIAHHLTQTLSHTNDAGSTPLKPISSLDTTATEASRPPALRYQVVTRPISRIEGPSHNPSEETWLITEDDSKLSAELSSVLSHKGVRLVRVRFSKNSVAAPDRLTFGTVNLWPEAFVDGLTDALRAAGIEIQGFIHAAGLATASASTNPAYPIHLLHPLASTLEFERLAVITSLGGNLGLERSPNLSRNVLQASMLGYSKALRREHPKRIIRALDINPLNNPKANAQWIIDEFLSSDTAMEVGFTGADRLIPELSPVESGQKIRRIGAQDVILITGGAGQIGARIAQWAAQQKPKGVIIAGRRPADDSINQLLAQLSAAGCTSAYVSADVTQPEALEGATRFFVDRVGRVTVVVHAAGVIEDAPAHKKSIESIERVMSTKVRGAQAIVQAFPELRDLILFSSWAGRFGNASQVDYSAANELLDRLAIASTGSTRTVSIDWPPWSSTHMVDSIPPPVRSAMEQKGVTFLEPEEGLEVFGDIFAEGVRGIELVGRQVPAREFELRSSEAFSFDRHPYLKDHRLNGQAVVPLASITDWIGSTAQPLVQAEQILVIESLSLARGVRGEEQAQLRLEGQFQADGQLTADVEVYAGPKRLTAYRAKIRTASSKDIRPTLELSGSPRTAPLTLARFYEEHTFHGPMLRGIKRLNRSTEQGISGIIRSSNIKNWMPSSRRHRWVLDPLILDGSFQLAGYWLHTHHGRAGFPTGFERLLFFKPFGREVHCTVRLERVDNNGFAGHLLYADAEGEPYALLENIRGQFADLEATGDKPAQSSDAESSNKVSRTASGARPRSVSHENGSTTPTSALPLSPAPTPQANGASPPIDIPEESWNVAEFPEVKALSQRFEMASLMGLHNPYFSVHAGTARDTSVVDGKELVHFSGYNYLGFSGRKEVIEAAQAAAAKYGTSVSASRVASGERPIHQEFEQGIAEHIGVEDAILYVGGHATNVTTVGHILDKEDLVVHDSLIHDSIFQGIKLSGAARRPFPHNDMVALERILGQVRSHYRRVLLCAEGIYSMDGDICDLPRLIALKKHYRCLLLVDEAHSIGVLGHQGRGIGHHFPDTDPKDVDMWMGTLSKSFASVGGYIAGRRSLIEYLKYTAPGFVYSVGLAPPNTAAAITSLRLMQKEPEVVERLRHNSRYFLEACQKFGLDTGLAAGAAVIPVIVGDSMTCVRLSALLKERGVNVQPIVYPAVEDESSRLRFFISALHTEEQLQFAARTTRDALEELRKTSSADQARV